MAAGPPTKKGKGLSFDEKRKRMEEFFHEKKDFFQLKDLEKMVPKEKGIVAQTVKEVLQSLIDDNLVNAEKIGTSNYFWSFPSTAMITRKRRIDGLRGDIEAAKNREEDLKRAIIAAKSGKDSSPERDELLREWRELEKHASQLNAQLEEYKENDPELHEAKQKQVKERKTAANKWTDNIDTLQSYCATNFNIQRDQLKEAFQLPSDLEYV